ncbi:calcium/proton exchanger, partial [Martensiomyces pterosporus]
QQISVRASLRNIALASWLNALVVVVPIGYVAHYLRWPVVAVFILNFIAIIPLSALMGFATEEVSLRLGPTWGGLINASFGNAVELIMAVIALIEEEYRIVQAGLIGSVLSNTLLVLGCAFLAGGIRHRVQLFHAEAAQCAGALLALSVLSMIIPAAYHGVHASRGEITNGILVMSRGTALILLVVYILFLVFQLKTHSDIFDGSLTHHMHEKSVVEEGSPQMKLWIAATLLALVCGLVALSSDILVDSVGELTSKFSISHTFVGMILLPIAANAAEHTMSVTVALRNKMDLCITVAVGSSMQMTLFVLPVLIIIAWAMNKPLSLFFDDFETTTMLISILVINYLIMNGRSNWLKGAMLLSSYSIVALAFFLYPNDVDDPRGSIATTPQPKQSFLLNT